MPFKFLKTLLTGKPSRLDRLEKRIRRLEYEMSRLSFKSPRKEIEKKKGNLEEKRKELSQESEPVYTSKGWRLPKKKVKREEPDKKWLLEFQCPECGNVSREGIEHSHLDEVNAHTDYNLYFNCKNCGWRSDLVRIRTSI